MGSTRHQAANNNPDSLYVPEKSEADYGKNPRLQKSKILSEEPDGMAFEFQNNKSLTEQAADGFDIAENIHGMADMAKNDDADSVSISEVTLVDEDEAPRAQSNRSPSLGAHSQEIPESPRISRTDTTPLNDLEIETTDDGIE